MLFVIFTDAPKYRDLNLFLTPAFNVSAIEVAAHRRYTFHAFGFLTFTQCSERPDDHIAWIWPDRGVDCRSVADCCAYWLVCSALKAVDARGHDGIRDTHSGRERGHHFIELAA